MVSIAEYGSVVEARRHFKDLLDAAESGRTASVTRDRRRTALVDGERLRRVLSTLRPSRAEVVHEAGGWSVFLPGLPIAADGATLQEALVEAVDALREYAADWADHLLHAPNHADNWSLVQLIDLSTDEQLVEWLTA